MARRCTTCAFTTDDPFRERCPECDGYLAIVCRTAVRPSVSLRPAPARSPWLIGVGVAAVVLVPVALWIVGRNVRPAGPGDAGSIAARGGRVGIGMPVRQAVLALEPEARADGRVTLHDLLAPDAPTGGRFTWSEGTRTLSVTFRRGKVTSVHEMTLPYPGVRQVTIDAADEPAADRDDAEAGDELPIPPRPAPRKEQP